MEAHQPANPEIEEAHNQPEETGTEHAISISDSLEERFGTLIDSDACVTKEDKTLIGQFPMFLGMETELKQYSQPRIMSIGPVHYGKDELKEGQRYKSYLTKHFIEQSHQSKEILYKNILEEIESFKECYDHQELLKFNGDDLELAWMLFVDGCALIQFVRIYVEYGFYDISIGLDEMNLVTTDLMRLDNQLPLGVLNLVMAFQEQSHEFRQSICRFIEIIEMIYFERWGKGVKADSVTDQSFNEANHLLELFWMTFVKKENGSYACSIEPTSRNFRSVKDLQAAGIIVEPNKSSRSLRDISFNHGILFGKLKIPSFLISEQVKFFVFNLIAFESHRNLRDQFVVTSYISFLNSLISSKEDVAELQKAGILFNHLPNDQEVVKTFRELTVGLKPYPDIFYLTKQKLIVHFNDKKRMTIGKWLSEAMQVYFRSPWTTIAFISATVLLIVTIIQTIFSILAYKRRETI